MPSTSVAHLGTSLWARLHSGNPLGDADWRANGMHFVFLSVCPSASQTQHSSLETQLAEFASITTASLRAIEANFTPHLSAI